MITFYYDKIVQGEPVPNGVSSFREINAHGKIVLIDDKDIFAFDRNNIRGHNLFYYTCLHAGVPIKIISSENELINEFTFYPIELNLNPDAPNCITSLIPENTLNLLRNKKLKLLLLYQEEGGDYWCVKILKEQVLEKFLNKGVPKENIFTVLSDLNKTYKSMLHNINIYGIDWWQTKHKFTVLSRKGIRNCYYTTKRNYDNELKEKQKENENFVIEEFNNPSKLFLSFNGNNRIHRIGLISEIYTRRLEKFGHISFNIYDKSWFCCDPKDNRIVDHFKSKEYLSEKIRNILRFNEEKLFLDSKGDAFYSDDRYFLKEFYYDSLFSLVTETFAGNTIDVTDGDYKHKEDKNLWATEKIWKPISIGHPFMLLGSVNFLHYLRKQGYETFPELFDESYDSEPYLPKRIDMICDNIERLSKIPKTDLLSILNKIKPKLIHNKHVFLKKDPQEPFKKLFKEMKNDVGKRRIKI